MGELWDDSKLELSKRGRKYKLCYNTVHYRSIGKFVFPTPPPCSLNGENA